MHPLNKFQLTKHAFFEHSIFKLLTSFRRMQQDG